MWTHIFTDWLQICPGTAVDANLRHHCVLGLLFTIKGSTGQGKKCINISNKEIWLAKNLPEIPHLLVSHSSISEVTRAALGHSVCHVGDTGAHKHLGNEFLAENASTEWKLVSPITRRPEDEETCKDRPAGAQLQGRTKNLLREKGEEEISLL